MKGKKGKKGGSMDAIGKKEGASPMSGAMPDCMKKGGEVKKAHGKKEKHRLDKKARGGKIATPSSPLSGAEPKGLPGGGKAQTSVDKSND